MGINTTTPGFPTTKNQLWRVGTALRIMKPSDGFSAADSRNLPKVDYFMLLQFMRENDAFNAAEIKGAKILHSSRDAYVDNAIGYVGVKRENGKCVVKCRVTPEHKVRSKMYTVTATICESEEKVEEIKCQDCAASEGGCKHAICFFMWLIKRSEEPSVTSVISYWTKPKLSEAVTKDKHVLAQDLTKRKHNNVQYVPQLTKDNFINECKRRKIRDVLVLNYSKEKTEELCKLSVFNMAVECSMENGGDFTYEDFKTYCEGKITKEKIDAIEKNTVGQSDNKLWHNLRRARITASKIHEAAHCKTPDGVLVKTILGGYKVFETAAIKRGKLLENKVIKQLQTELNKPIKKCGFILITPFMGASPDGLCDEFVIEVKCPISKKTMKKYINNGTVTEKYKAQIMLQMNATKLSVGLFCVADPEFEQNKLIHKHLIQYDETYVENLVQAAEDIWKQNIFPKVIECAITK